MTLDAIKQGFETLTRRPSLAGILYGMNLLVGILIAVPLAVLLSSSVAGTGFGPDMAADFDITLWADVFEDSGAAARVLIMQLLWIVPIYLGWKIASTVGLLHASGLGGGRSFWEGIGRHTMRGLLIGLLYLIPFLGVVILSLIAGVIVSGVLGGEVGIFWAWWVTTPVLIVLGAALIDLMEDFALAEHVLGNRTVVQSWLRGMSWPFTRPITLAVYGFWWIVGTAVVFFAFVLDIRLGGIWSAFLLQQLLLLGRAGITVGWIASEAAIYEDDLARSTPVFADAEAAA